MEAATLTLEMFDSARRILNAQPVPEAAMEPLYVTPWVFAEAQRLGLTQGGNIVAYPYVSPRFLVMQPNRIGKSWAAAQHLVARSRELPFRQTIISRMLRRRAITPETQSSITILG